MKRILFFFGVLAIVAVGHAGAKNVNAKLNTQAGPLNTEARCEFETIEADCNPIDNTTPCKLIDGVTDAYTNASGEEGKCTIPLFYSVPN